MTFERESALTEGLGEAAAFYHVHSFACRPTRRRRRGRRRASTASASCRVVERGNVMAAQFHPEKSSRDGLRMLRNFAAAGGGGRRMILYPAIDIMDGQAVRLVEGEFEDATTYHDDPLEAAKSWVDAGARFLHVVDLDGARSGAPKSLDHLRRIVAETGIPVQYGGGLRTVDDRPRRAARRRRARGRRHRRVPRHRLPRRHRRRRTAPRIVVAVDVKDGMIATEGWTQTTSLPAVDAIQRLTEPRRALVRLHRRLARRQAHRARPRRRQAASPTPCAGASSTPAGSARSTTCARWRKLRQVNLAGVIAGKSLYEKKFTVAEGQAALDGA